MNDLTMYEEHAAGWWDRTNPYFRSLISVNEFRVELLNRWRVIKPGYLTVDLGCGGGLMAAPCEQAGADIVGIDLSPGSLRTAREHTSSRACYATGDVRAVPLADGCADAVIVADVIDHVSEYEKVLAECARLLKPGGKLFVTTLNRSWFSRLVIVALAEGLGFIPKGTHDANLFIRPTELRNAAAACGMNLIEISGCSPKFFRSIFTRTITIVPGSFTALAYAMLFEKTGGQLDGRAADKKPPV